MAQFRSFASRAEAGRMLAEAVARQLSAWQPDAGQLGAGEPSAEQLGVGVGRPLVLALPRGGVPVAVPVARALGADLDVVIARKIGAPGEPELGIGAFAEDGPPLVDDGLATGVTALAALRWARGHRPARLIMAVPVAAPAAREAVARVADAVICLYAPPGFHAVGDWYDDFSQLSDDDVVDGLRARQAG